MNFNRREALRIGLHAGLAIAGQKLWAVEAVPVLDQEKVNRIYVDLYKYIEEEQKKAGKRDLVIVVAESHTSVVSSILLESILTNICFRLGIRQYAMELDNADNFTGDNSGLYEDIVAKGSSALNYQEIEVLKNLESGDLSQIKFPDKFDPGAEVPSGTFSIAYAYKIGLTLIAGDPLRFSAPFTPEGFNQREAAMVKTLGKIKGSVQCKNGAWHASHLVEELAKDKGKHVIGLDFSYGVERYMPALIVHDKDLDPTGFFAKKITQRLEERKKLHRIEIPIDTPLKADQAFASALLASYDHMVADKKMNIARQQLLNELISKIVPNVLGLRGTQAR